MQLRLSWKLALISICSVLPLLCGTFYLINRYTNKDIHFAELEIKGLRSLGPLEKALELLPQRLAASLNAPASASTTSLDAELDRAFADANTLLFELGPDLRYALSDADQQQRSGVPFTRILQRWQAVKAPHPDVPARELSAAYEQLQTDLLLLVNYLGNTSNLILDPDLDSYYLMDIAVAALPQSQERLNALIANTHTLLSQSILPSKDRIELANQAKRLTQLDTDRILLSARTALAADPSSRGPSESLQKAFPRLLDAYARATGALTVHVREIAASDSPAMTPDDFERSADEARLASSELWSAANRELAWLLQHRIDEFTTTRVWGLVLVAVSLAFAGGVTVLVARSINRVEGTLIASEKRLRETLDQMMEGCQIISHDWRYLYVNDAAVLGAQLPRAALLGKTIFSCFPHFDNSLMHLALKRCMESRSPARLEVPFTHLDGNVAWYELGVQPVPEGLFILSLDITARKRAEISIQEQNTLLERRVAQRTAELEAANKELETFSYSVSHDLRAPLRAIAGFTDALSKHHRDRLNAEGSRYLDRVLAGTERMSQLIDDLLNLSRLTRMDLVRRQVDLSALVRSVIEGLVQAAPQRQVDFVIAEGVTVDADPRLLRAALENLLGNAWKFTGNKPLARIEFGSYADADGKSVCFVRDNGAGFDMAYAGKLFAPFQRLHTLSEFPGTGIGLATVNRIIQRHGGRVWAESQPDVGTTLFFTL